MSSPAPPGENIQIGDVLAGKYKVERVLGQGGMGVVVAAMHMQLNERVALKFLLPAAAAKSGTVARFLREAQAAAKIKNEHIAHVTDVGTLDTGLPYLVMEYLEGDDLKNTIKASGPLPVAQAVDFVLQACEALAEAHSKGIIHRDLKPANLFLARRAGGEPLVKVLDFGIAKAISTGSDITATTDIMGSPAYMSPEQIRSSKDVDPRSDIWSLGVVLFDLLTGHTPFESEAIHTVIASIMTDIPAPISKYRDDIPEGVSLCIARCLSKNREERFGSVAEFAAALAPFGSRGAQVSFERISSILGVSTSAAESAAVGRLPVGRDTNPPDTQAAQQTNAVWQTSTGAEPSSPPPVPRPLTPLIAAGAVAALGLAGLGLWGAFGGGSSPPPALVAASAPLAASAPPPASSTSVVVEVTSAAPPASSVPAAATPAGKSKVPAADPKKNGPQAPAGKTTKKGDDWGL